MWIRLLPETGVTGYYRAKREQARLSCTDCEKLALACFRTGQLPARCPRCGGSLVVIAVDIAR